MKTSFLFGILLPLTFAIAGCSKKPAPGPDPGPGPGSGNEKIEHVGTTQLSAPRKELKAAAAGTKILFAGGTYSLNQPNTVDIYDVTTNTWTTSTLTTPRIEHAMTAFGNKIFIAGGWAPYSGINVTNSVEIYDVTTGKWAYQALSSPRISLAATSLQNKAFFGGGGTLDKDGVCCIVSDRVDIYDLSTGSWSKSALSIPRDHLAAAAIGNKVLFAGGYGHSNQTGGFFSSRVDIYDITTGKWSIAELSEARDHLYAAAAGNKILFAGGRNSNSSTAESKIVDIYDVSTGKWSTSALSEDRQGTAIAVIGNKILVAGGYSNKSAKHLSSVDVYDVSSGKWDKLELSEARMDGAAAGIKNKLLVGGGFAEVGFSKTVDIFGLTD
ncbi:Kelch repeat-containing protein [Chitinophaga sp. 22321]|uniref:Attractin/MKLN-like beta-propeller domain-containing protein n=1 Tax=Chitinophaga hostae TaxID=2831022 RepID=A0ABS5J652_9BACT|nr:kelch repeat-containing protein [Chitinophaga hostae]MBS0030699.1 hypothetical protein [Chitinophaga hostae]